MQVLNVSTVQLSSSCFNECELCQDIMYIRIYNLESVCVHVFNTPLPSFFIVSIKGN